MICATFAAASPAFRYGATVSRIFLTVPAAPFSLVTPSATALAIAVASFVHSTQNSASSRSAAQVIGPAFALRSR